MDTNAAAIAQLVTNATALLFTGHTASGDPIRRAARIINGHHVAVTIIGYGQDDAVEVCVDKSTEVLTVAQAAERVA